MVTLFFGTKAVRWADAEAVFAAAATEAVEFRDAAGRVIAVTTRFRDTDPDWVRAITPEDTARREAGTFLTLEEYRRLVDQP